VEKLIVMLSILTLLSCKNPREEQKAYCKTITDIGINNVQEFLKSLDSVEIIDAKIIEYRIENNDVNYFFADMFISKPYLKGQELPKYYRKVKYQEREIHLLVYCDNFSLTLEDSIKILTEIINEKLVVNNVLEWTTYGDWSTQDINYLRFIFCKNDVYKYTKIIRNQVIENELNKPNCF